MADYPCKKGCEGVHFDSPLGWKMHMSKTHGQYTEEDMKEVGVTPSARDIARNLAGNTSAREVAEKAPDSEPTIGEADGKPQGVRRRRTQAPAVDPEVEAAKERIIRARCQRIATLPYSLLAGLVGDDRVRLSDLEARELTEAYVTLSKAYGWEGTSKLLLWGDVMICHAAIIGQKDRKEAILGKFSSEPEQPAQDPEQQAAA